MKICGPTWRRQSDNPASCMFISVIKQVWTPQQHKQAKIFCYSWGKKPNKGQWVIRVASGKCSSVPTLCGFNFSHINITSRWLQRVTKKAQKQQQHHSLSDFFHETFQFLIFAASPLFLEQICRLLVAGSRTRYDHSHNAPRYVLLTNDTDCLVIPLILLAELNSKIVETISPFHAPDTVRREDSTLSPSFHWNNNGSFSEKVTIVRQSVS